MNRKLPYHTVFEFLQEFFRVATCKCQIIEAITLTFPDAGIICLHHDYQFKLA